MRSVTWRLHWHCPDVWSQAVPPSIEPSGLQRQAVDKVKYNVSYDTLVYEQHRTSNNNLSLFIEKYKLSEKETWLLNTNVDIRRGYRSEGRRSRADSDDSGRR